jgi:hypothetical protein
MTTVDAYSPELWHDFFVMVGCGAAVCQAAPLVSHTSQQNPTARSTRSPVVAG